LTLKLTFVLIVRGFTCPNPAPFGETDATPSVGTDAETAEGAVTRRDGAPTQNQSAADMTSLGEIDVVGAATG
jgi:hypothetical protein